MQAQTVANFYLAFEQNLAILPVLNKCDMRTAQPEEVAEQMQQVPLLRYAYFQLFPEVTLLSIWHESHMWLLFDHAVSLASLM